MENLAPHVGRRQPIAAADVHRDCGRSGQHERARRRQCESDATRPQLAGLLLAEAVQRVLVGLILGVVVAAAGGTLLKSLLFGVSAFDVRVVAASAGVLLVSAIAACLWPAWRASGADPAEIMR